jgi:TRAP-type C4-dicarboxylate transport system substrate-binding protein
MRRIELSLLILIVVISGCATDYYGYSKQQWNALSREQQAVVIEQYDYILQEKEEQRHEDLIESYRQKVIERGLDYSFPR